MFSTPEAARISDTHVAVRMLGGDDLDEEGETFIRRYGLRGFPALLALTADGAVLSRRFDRSLEGILAEMDAAATSNAEFVAREVALRAKSDAASVRALAGLYKGRSQFEEARSAYERLLSISSPQLDDQLALLEVVEALGDAKARKALLATLVQSRPGDERNIDWRVDLALADLPTQIRTREEFMEVMGEQRELLTRLLGTLERTGDQAVVRHHIASNLSRTGDHRGAVAHWRWILDRARTSRPAPVALWLIAQEHFKKARDAFTGAFDVAQLQAGKALLQEILDRHPEHAIAEQARGLVPQIDAVIRDQAEKEKPQPEEQEVGEDK